LYLNIGRALLQSGPAAQVGLLRASLRSGLRRLLASLAPFVSLTRISPRNSPAHNIDRLEFLFVAWSGCWDLYCLILEVLLYSPCSANGKTITDILIIAFKNSAMILLSNVNKNCLHCCRHLSHFITLFTVFRIFSLD